MKRRRVEEICLTLSALVDSNDDSVESVAHEVAHMILLFGRVRAFSNGLIDERCNKMPASRANEHEAKALALQLAGLRKLGYRQSLVEATELSWDGIRNDSARSAKFATLADFRRQVRSHTPSKRNVQRFVAVFKQFERLI